MLKLIVLAVCLSLPSIFFADRDIKKTPSQWQTIQATLSLTTQEISSIEKQVGPLSDFMLDDLTKAVTNMKSRHMKSSEPLPLDALIADPKHHTILIENEYFRILWATINVGESGNFHTHQWPSIFLVTSAQTNGITHKLDGSMIEEPWEEPGVYEFDAQTEPLKFTNSGPHDFRALAIELKQTLP